MCEMVQISDVIAPYTTWFLVLSDKYRHFEHDRYSFCPVRLGFLTSRQAFFDLLHILRTLLALGLLVT